MMAVIGAFLGVLVALGVVLVVAGSQPVFDDPPETTGLPLDRLNRRAVLGSLGGAAAAWAISGWPAAGVLGACAAVVGPRLLAARKEKQLLLDKTAALATWAEMLHDTIASHAGINQALVTSCEVAPELIRSDVERLMRRAERGSLVEALKLFGAEMADPVADMVVAALVIAIEGRARDLPQLLAEIAASARRQASTQLRVETGRSRTYAQARSLVGITMVAAVGLVVFSPQFMAPYDSLIGQCVLGLVSAMFASALWMMVTLSKPIRAPRLFSGAAVNTNGEALI